MARKSGRSCRSRLTGQHFTVAKPDFARGSVHATPSRTLSVLVVHGLQAMAVCCLFVALKCEEKVLVLKMESLLKWAHHVEQRLAKQTPSKLDVDSKVSANTVFIAKGRTVVAS